MIGHRRPLLVLAVASLAIASSAVAFGWTGTASRIAVQALIGTWSDQPNTPDICKGMTFDAVIVGTDGPDRLAARSGSSLIFGLGGDDIIEGRSGRDCLVGGPGKDLISGRLGDDVLSGDRGDDLLIGGPGGDRLYGASGNDTLYGGDRDVHGHRDTKQGGMATETARIGGGGGTHGRDRLDGGADKDRCIGTRADTFVSCERRSLARSDPSGDTDERAVDPGDQPSNQPPGDATAVPSDDPPASEGADPGDASTPPSGTESSDPGAASPEPDATAGDDPSPSADADPTATPTPTAAPTDTPTDTPSPTPSPTPEPTATPEPIVTTAPEPTFGDDDGSGTTDP